MCGAMHCCVLYASPRCAAILAMSTDTVKLQAAEGTPALVVPMVAVLHPCDAHLQEHLHRESAPAPLIEDTGGGVLGCRGVCEAVGALMASYSTLGAALAFLALVSCANLHAPVVHALARSSLHIVPSACGNAPARSLALQTTKFMSACT